VLLFVYGTLRRGEANHAQLDDARFIGTARTEPQYELVDLGGYPALLEDGETAVVGELYEVDASRLARLDSFEEVPSLYERKSIRVANTSAEVYVMPRERAHEAPRIMDGDWRAQRRHNCSQ
jgi:gamma-glutamylcyclotransferase (GGCT)/AIG2-like uncharacterized protein YtfP